MLWNPTKNLLGIHFLQGKQGIISLDINILQCLSPAKMSAFKSSISFIFLSCFLLISTTATTAFNITTVLEKDDRFSTINDLLIKTNLTGEINREGVATVLAIPNDQIGDLASKPIDIMKTILRTHVVLDYYDLLKLQSLTKPTIMTNLYQKTGVATYGQGFLNVTKNGRVDKIIFASTAKGAPHDVHLLGTVAAIPPKLSVLSVSHSIVTPGVEAITFAPPPHVANAPAPAKKVATPAPAAEEPEAPSPADDATTPTEAPSDAPSADAPTSSAPKADAPVADAADAKAPKSAGFKNLASSSLGFIVVFAAILAAY